MEEDKSWKKWKMPEVDIGDDVIYYKNMDTKAGGLLGKVTAVNGKIIDIVIFQHGHTQARTSLHHIDDEGLRYHADDWIEAGSGVFKLAKSTKRQRAALEKIARLETIFADLVIKADGTDKPEHPKRNKGGRPRKNPKEDTGPATTEPKLASA